MSRKFHLAFFTKFGAPAWRAGSDRLHGGDWWTGDYYIDLARRLEAACFDFLFFEDGSAVFEAGGSMETDLKNSVYAPQHDPLPLLPVLARYTRQIGFVATASTSVYPPYLLARSLSTIDSLSGGRVGWNIVTSAAADNYGKQDFPYGSRYDIADEFLRIAIGLWESWDEGALVRDEATETYVDHTRVHQIDFEGRFLRSRGPLNTLRSPQVRPVLAQAGGSEAGMDFAARYAEVILTTTAGGLDGMRTRRDDIRRRVQNAGREPDQVKVLYLANLAFTDRPDQPITDLITDSQVLVMRAAFGSVIGVDLMGYDLDDPFPVGLDAKGNTSILRSIEDIGRAGGTMRDALIAYNYGVGQLELFGAPETIADKMADAMDEIGGDGFLIHGTSVSNAAYLDALTKGVVPRLQERGVARTCYKGATLREVLREF